MRSKTASIQTPRPTSFGGCGQPAGPPAQVDFRQGPAQVADALGRLGFALGETPELMERLYERLRPVLSPLPPRAAAIGEGPGIQLVPLADAVQAMTNQVAESNDRLRDLLSCIEL